MESIRNTFFHHPFVCFRFFPAASVLLRSLPSTPIILSHCLACLAPLHLLLNGIGLCGDPSFIDSAPVGSSVYRFGPSWLGTFYSPGPLERSVRLSFRPRSVRHFIVSPPVQVDFYVFDTRRLPLSPLYVSLSPPSSSFPSPNLTTTGHPHPLPPFLPSPSSLPSFTIPLSHILHKLTPFSSLFPSCTCSQ